MTLLVWPTKDPDAILDYQVDWSSWLGSDVISSSTWIVPADLTKVSEDKTNTTATIWLSGGVEPKTYEITNRIVTLAGRQNDRTVQLPCRNL
jgi:hypothetical protein